MKTLTVTLNGSKQEMEFIPCPYCESSDLWVIVMWTDARDYDAIECNNCIASAPAEIWNNRVPGDNHGPVDSEDN